MIVSFKLRIGLYHLLIRVLFFKNLDSKIDFSLLSCCSKRKYPATSILAYKIARKANNRFERDHVVVDDEWHLVAQIERSSENLRSMDRSNKDRVEDQ